MQDSEQKVSKPQKNIKAQLRKMKTHKLNNKKCDLSDEKKSNTNLQLKRKSNVPYPKTNLRAPDKPVAEIANKKTLVALDCEMVGCGYQGRKSELARVSIVDYNLKTVYDSYVKPREEVTDYRTFVSGIERRHLINAKSFESVQKEVFPLLSGKVLVGHAIHHDLKALKLQHSWRRIRDTSTYRPFRELMNGSTPSLKNLTSYYLHKDIQLSQHSSVEDAKSTMMLYKKFENEWESSLLQKKISKKR